MEIKKPAFTLSWEAPHLTAEQSYVAEEFMKKAAENMQIEIERATMDTLTYGTSVISPEGKSISPTEFYKEPDLCGSCQRWGVNPNLDRGRCVTCDRSEDEIRRTHGIVDVTGQA